ncbi:MAG: hypothetical protein K8S99_17955 [Planctomycetes bacterium]|nr:hypothetical protein [Planctomycetota bacterium]
MKRPRRILLALLAVMLSLHGWLGARASVEQRAAQTTAAPTTQPHATGSAFFTALPSGANVAIIRVEGELYDYTVDSFKRRADQAIKNGASVIVVELDTTGGLVTSALDLSRAIKNLPVPTIAWVNPIAYSGGIMVAAACNAILMAPASALGDCAPIVPGMNLSPTERAKALSPILTEFRDSAQRNGYDYTLFHAMCELGVEVSEIQNIRTGEHRLVSQGDYEIMVAGATPDAVRAAARTRTQSGNAAAQPSQPVSPLAPLLPNLSGAATANTPTIPTEELGGFMPEEATDADRAAWKDVRVVHDGKSLLTMHQNEAINVRLASGIVRDDADLQQFLSAATIARYNQSWTVGAAHWLTHPVVRGVLIVVMLLGAYIEFQAPGVSLPGAVAVIALLLLLVSPFLVGLGEVWHLIMFVIGLGLLIFELVMPHFGLIGILGIVLMLAGLILAVVPTSGSGPVPMPAPEMIGRLQQSFIWTCLAIICSAPGFWLITRYFGNIPVLNRLVLHNPVPAMDGGGWPATGQVSGGEALGHGTIKVGSTGRAVSNLRPSGRAEIDGQTIDVVTPGAWIEPGTPVRVVEVQGNRIVVEAERTT